MAKNPITAMRLPRDDRSLLEALSRVQKVTKSEVVRRALRFYAESLGVTAAPVDKQRSRREQQNRNP